LLLITREKAVKGCRIEDAGIHKSLGIRHISIQYFMTCILRFSRMKTVTVTCNVRRDPEWGIANG